MLIALAVACATVGAAGPPVTAPIVPTDPDAAGRELAAQLRSLRPAGSLTNSAILRVFERRKLVREQPIDIFVSASETNWSTIYLAGSADGARRSRLRVTRSAGGETQYHLRFDQGDSVEQASPSGAGLMVAFADSEFWLADLGMEFLQWPIQRLLKKEICRGQSCDKLESIAPAGQTNGYVRVVSWFDIDTGGPVLVEAYDAAGRMVKEFKPNDFKKVNGQWQVEEVEISNPRTGFRSTIRFNLEGKPQTPETIRS